MFRGREVAARSAGCSEQQPDWAQSRLQTSGLHNQLAVLLLCRSPQWRRQSWPGGHINHTDFHRWVRRRKGGRSVSLTWSCYSPWSGGTTLEHRQAWAGQTVPSSQEPGADRWQGGADSNYLENSLTDLNITGWLAIWTIKITEIPILMFSC